MGRMKAISIYLASMIIFSALFVMNVSETEASGGSFGGGSGTEGDPYIIEDVWDLQNMSSNLSAHYVLGNDINASDTINWNSGAGFDPIGSSSSRFTGSLNGKGHSISNLFINRSSDDHVGLFGYIIHGGSLKNITLIDIEVQGGRDVGGFAGYSFELVISNCQVSGSITGAKRVGGLVGSHSGGTLSSCYTSVKIIGKDDVGGIVGSNWGSITDSYSTENINGNTNIGGLIGYNDGILSNSYSVGDVNGGFVVGGLVGYNRKGTVIDCYATGSVCEGAKGTIGGLIGCNDGDVTGCHSSGDVSGDKVIGGLVGSNNGRIFDSYSASSVSGHSHIGGLIGENRNRVSRCHSSGFALGNNYVGGLSGVNGGEISDSYTITTVFGTLYTGGLVGLNSGEIDNSYYNIDLGSMNEGEHVTICGIYNDQFVNWLTNNLTLKISDYNKSLMPSGEFYTIKNIQGMKDLLGFADVEGYRFRLDADIDLSEYPGFYMPYFAAAEFDGGGHVISNLKINSSNDHIGLFGYNKGAIIKNITVENSEVIGKDHVGSITGRNNGELYRTFAIGSVKGDRYIGGLAGTNRKDGMVLYSNFSGNVIGRSSVGGLVGANGGHISASCSMGYASGDGGLGGLVGLNHGIISKSCSTANVNAISNVGGLAGTNYCSIMNSYATGDVSGTRDYVGGLVGENDGTVKNSYANGDVIGSNYTGGLIGLNYGDVSFCYSSGSVSCRLDFGKVMRICHIGGLVGKNYAMVSYSFWDMDTSCQIESDGGTGKTTGEMKQPITYIDPGWDLDKVWFLFENRTYPLLKWQDVITPIADAGPDRFVPIDTDGKATVVFDGRGSRDDLGITKYIWGFEYNGLEIHLNGETAEFTFKILGMYIVTLNVSDSAGHWDIDKMTLTVIDQCIVTGVVRDLSGKPLEGVYVEITSSDGNTYTYLTGENGSFSLLIPHGEFEWRISKSGYVPISGTSRMDPMGEVELDLSASPLVKEKGSSPSIVPYLILAAILIVLIAGIIYILTKKGVDPRSSMEE